MDTPIPDQGALLVERVKTFPQADRRELLKYVAELTVVGLVYFAVAKLGLTLASIHPSATPIWPTTGVTLAAVLLRGYRISPGIFAGALLANVTTAGSIFTSLGIATGNTLESLVGAYVVNQWSDGLNTFDTPVGVGKFALTCLVPSTMISATLGVGSLSLAGYARLAEFRAIWTTWWMGDLAGALVITPVIVLWSTRIHPSLERNIPARTVALYTSAIAIGLVAFSPLFPGIPGRPPLAFLAVLPLMWAAVRCDQRDTATTAFLLSCFAVWGAMANGGPFVRGNLNDSFLLLLAFMISVSVPSLALRAEVAVRKRHEQHVDFVMHELSHRSKNLLSVVQSMAHQVARRSDNFEAFFLGFSTRLRAFSETHDLLVRGNWHGAGIRELTQIQLAPFHNPDEDSIIAEGVDLTLTPKAAEQIGMALHELGTNAAKHGALSTATGMVRIRWELETDEAQNPRLRLTWKETGGPRVRPSQREGFGTLMITKAVPATLQGTASLTFEPQGVRWVLLTPSTNALI